MIAATAAVRRAWRAGSKAGEGIPASSEALLALLPDTLRAAVFAHFAPDATTTTVGTAVGIHDNAAGIDDPDGAVSR